MTRVTTGYYGGFDATGRMRVTKVHKLGLNGRPTCGIRLAPYMAFQYCSHSGHYVECERCQRKTI